MSGGAPNLGFSIANGDSRVQSADARGRAGGRGPNEVVVDKETAAEQEYKVGEKIGVQAEGRGRRDARVGRRPVQLGPHHRRRDARRLRSPDGAASLQEGRQARTRSRSPRSRRRGHGARRRDQAILPPTAQVRTGSEQAQDEAAEMNDFISFLRTSCSPSRLSHSSSARSSSPTRSRSRSRSGRASSRRCGRSAHRDARCWAPSSLESLVIGLLASLIGLGLGVLLAEGIDALFRSLGVELPQANRVFAARTVVVSLIVGVGITLLAGLFPAIRATRVPPIAAVREGASLPRSRFARFTPWIAAVLVAFALVALARAMFTDELGTERSASLDTLPACFCSSSESRCSRRIS